MLKLVLIYILNIAHLVSALYLGRISLFLKTYGEYPIAAVFGIASLCNVGMFAWSVYENYFNKKQKRSIIITIAGLTSFFSMLLLIPLIYKLFNVEPRGIF